MNESTRQLITLTTFATRAGTMHIAALSYMFAFLVASISCQCCPEDTVPCGTTCCDLQSGQLGGYFCANRSKSLCCPAGWHDSNGICCQHNQENCGGACCGGDCVTVHIGRFGENRVQFCWYSTDGQCENIGAYGLCTPDGGCSQSYSRCDGNCCFSVPH